MSEPSSDDRLKRWEFTVTLKNDDLRKFDLGFDKFQEKLQEVTIRFTRDSSTWPTAGAETGGTVDHVAVEKSVRATALVFVVAEPAPKQNQGTRISTVSATAGEGVGRAGVLRLLVHELVHVRQGWTAGSETSAQTSYTRESIAARDRALRKNFFLIFNREELLKQAYKGNSYEIEAYKEADTWCQIHKDQIAGKVFDRYIPPQSQF